MNSKEFKKIFGNTAKANGFEFLFGGWFKESDETIVVLQLQKSNFGDYYDMNLKIYLQGIFGTIYKKSKNLVKTDVGDVFTRQPPHYGPVFNFDNIQTDHDRTVKLQELFQAFINPLTSEALSIAGLQRLAEEKKIKLLPAVKEELIRLTRSEQT